MKQFYEKNIECVMQAHCKQLSEKDRRHYVAVECKKLGRGGCVYLVKLFDINYRTIKLGLSELENPVLCAEIPEGKIRRKGGGRKKILSSPE
jgi:hypothetical protein